MPARGRPPPSAFEKERSGSPKLVAVAASLERANAAYLKADRDEQDLRRRLDRAGSVYDQAQREIAARRASISKLNEDIRDLRRYE